MFGKLIPGVPREFRSITPKQLFESPELRAIAQRASEETLAKRRELAEQLKEVTGAKADARCAKAVKACRDADAKLAAAKAAAESARQEVALTQMELASQSAQIAYQRDKLLRELIAIADPRLAHFRRALDDAWQDVRNTHAWPEIEMTDPGTTDDAARRDAAERYENLPQAEQWRARVSGFVAGAKAPRAAKFEQVIGALQRIQAMQADVAAAQIEALDDDEVTKRLNAWRAEMRALLNRAGVRPLMSDESVAEAA